MRKKYNSTPKNPRVGEKYDVRRDYQGNLLEYTTYEYNDEGTKYKINHKAVYDTNNRKIAYYDSNGTFSNYEYNSNGELIYEVNGSVRTGISTEHWYDNNKEIFRRRVDADTMQVREHRNDVQVAEYYNPFIRIYCNPLYR